MANRPATFTKNELKGYADVMREANIPAWSVTAEKPDGTRVTITAGEVEAGGNAIDRMLGIK